MRFLNLRHVRKRLQHLHRQPRRPQSRRKGRAQFKRNTSRCTQSSRRTAQMCIKVAKAAAALVMGEEDDMKSLWYPVAKCAAHIVEMADHVVNSAQTVGEQRSWHLIGRQRRSNS